MSDSTYTEVPFTIFTDFGSVSSSKGKKAVAGVNPKMKDKKLTVLKVIVIILAALILIEGVLYTLLIPSLATVKMQFRGMKNVPMSELTAKANALGMSTWMQFDASKAAAAFGSIPEVEKVTVDKHFPDRVIIEIKERETVAKTLVVTGGKAVPVQIDRNGVLYTSNTTSVLKDTSIPVISGLPVTSVHSGMRIPDTYRSLMEQIAKIRELPQNYFAAISEIQVVPKDYGGYELILYPIHSKVKVLTDQNLNEETLKYMMVSLDVVNSIEPDVIEIDVRYGAVSYRKR